MVAVIEPQKVVSFSEELSKQHAGNLQGLAAKFDLNEDWLQKQNSNMSAKELIQCMLWEFGRKATVNDFTTTLKQLGIQDV